MTLTIVPTNKDEVDLIEQQYDAWLPKSNGCETPRQVFGEGWSRGFDAGVISAALDLEMANEAEHLARAYRGAVLFAWEQMHKARRSIEEARSRGEGTLRSGRDADAHEIALRALLLVRKLGRAEWTGE